MIGERRASEKHFGRSSNHVPDTIRMRNQWIVQHNLRTTAGDWPSSRHYGRLLAHRGRFDRFRATTSMVVYFRLVQKQTRALKPSPVMWRALVSTTERTMNRQGKGKRRLGSRPIGKPGRGARTVGARSLPNHITFHKAVGCRNMADRCNRTVERSGNCASRR
jgi:hypothetical protein